jgi:hypothetical protein
MHNVTLWREPDQEQSNRCADQYQLTDHGEDRDDWVTPEEQEIQSSRKHGPWR